MTDRTERLSTKNCLSKAKECRRLASIRSMPDAHRVMLQHIAETWERIAAQSRRKRKRDVMANGEESSGRCGRR